MKKQDNPTNPATESTQLAVATDKMASKPKSKPKVKSDKSVNRSNQVADNNQPGLFKGELDAVNTPIAPDEDVDIDALFEQSIIRTTAEPTVPDKPGTEAETDTTKVSDDANVADATNEPSAVEIPASSDAVNAKTSPDAGKPSAKPDDVVAVSEPDAVSEVDESRPTRISAKQRREELDSFKSEYLLPHKFEKKHNVAIEDEQWEQLDLIVRRVGDRKSNATSYLNSIIAAHLREVLPKVKEWMKL